MKNRSLNVFSNGKKVGRLWETPSSALRFKYDENVITPISVRLPITEVTYADKYARPFFENLTPEAEIKTLVSKRMGVSENNPLSILDKIGGDCAGAISLFEDKPIFDLGMDLKIITNDEFIGIIKKLPKNPLMTGVNDNVRLSLAGAQPKFAIFKCENVYHYPTDRFPSTHIIKVKNKDIPHLLENEMFCMKLAAKLGLNAPTVALKEIDDVKYLEIERYDRQVNDCKIERINQEDFCQVLGFLSAQKYQKEGGPSFKSVFKAITNHINYQLALNIHNFTSVILFNYLIGNNDAHGKNFSILHREGRITLAPFYDLLSTRVYGSAFDTNLAMSIGGEVKSDNIIINHFSKQAVAFKLSPKHFTNLLQGQFKNIVSIANKLMEELNSEPLTKSPIYKPIIALIEARFNKLCK